MDICEWLEFQFYGIFWFWNNQSDDKNPILKQLLVVSQMAGSVLCYWILGDKGKVITRTTVNQINNDKPRDLNVHK